MFDWTIIYSGTNAQSFTPTVETLSAVELLLNGLPEGGFAGTKRCKPNSSNTIRVDVRDSSWTLIGSKTQTVTLSGAATIDPSEWVRFSFDDDIALTPGSLYSFEPIVSGPFPSGCERIMWAFEWNIFSGHDYTGGAMETNPGHDYLFRTYTGRSDLSDLLGVPGKGVDTAPGLQKEFNERSSAAENVSK
ncbi:MAG: hypothetical protein O3A47_08000 [Chloroflexi bacterium]|nr:hypothetical protein [Chloroflexota bacterium]